MPFIPHTDDDVTAMLSSIGAATLDDLFDEIPPSLQCGDLPGIPPALGEMDITRLMTERAESDGRQRVFLGAGAYEHHIPAAVWQIATRGEFYSAYTPYQAEASQGTLQLLYEFQTMMASLTGLDVSNASLYDGASALAEAILMAVRVSKSATRRVLVPRTVHPLYRRTAQAIVRHQGIQLVDIPFDAAAGTTALGALDEQAGEGVAALVIPAPNFFGQLEDVNALTDWAHEHSAQAIAVCNPMALALIKPPGQRGETGADICCGDAQPLGIPLSGGGPYLGYLTAKKALVRQMPGRIIGRTVDMEGRPGFTLTLQAREQHIRRSKATSNICTNQGLMVTAATIYMAITGAEGLARIAAACHANTRRLAELLDGIPGVGTVFQGPFFHETVVRLPRPATGLIEQLAAQGFLAGFDLKNDYPELGNTLLVCATETKTEADLQAFARALRAALYS
ncbi:MAG: aminomethyl-transferring glycine dehydrogenase subunit GcvPA [Rhodocyclaceae bacterium]